MVINGQGWQNHEESFEETLRREMLSARQALWLVKMDLKELQKAHYKLLKRPIPDAYIKFKANDRKQPYASSEDLFNLGKF